MVLIHSTNYWMTFGSFAAYASASTFTVPGNNYLAAKLLHSLFTCTDSTGVTRRYGYVKSTSYLSDVITVTVVTDTDLVNTDINFAVSTVHKINNWEIILRVSGALSGDPVNAVGEYYLDIKGDRYLLPVDSALKIAAGGVGATCAWNIYKDTSVLFGANPDLGSNYTLNEQRPSTKIIEDGKDLTVRVHTVIGTPTPSNLQIRMYLIPQVIYDYME